MTYSELHLKYSYSLIESDFGGIHKAMFYDRGNDNVFVFYSDVESGLEFVLDPPKHLALDAYTHPICYFKSELNGHLNPNRLNPVEV